MSDEERERRSQGPTRIPIDEDRLKKIHRTRHAAKGRAERDNLRVHDKPTSRETLEAAFKASLQDDIEVTAAEEDALFKAAGELKKEAEKKPKKKSKKKKAEKGAEEPFAVDEAVEEVVKIAKAHGEVANDKGTEREE